MLVGYERVSSEGQELALQTDALKAAGCGNIFSDVASGATTQRPGLIEALSYVRKGDTLVVWRLDRLGRSLKHLIEAVSNLEEKGVGFRSLQEAIDTTTSGGRLIFQIFGALAEFERNLILERTQAGLTAARARGRKGGRPKIFTDQKIMMAKELIVNKNNSVSEICKTLSMSKASFYRLIKQQ
jgi:DNA invertase Pin-like site-specific DNA recombinase